MEQYPADLVVLSPGGALFADLKGDIAIGSYHSLVADHLSSYLIIAARKADGSVMAVENKSLPISAAGNNPQSW